MKLEEAIKIAIENGWKPFAGYLRKKFEMEDDCAIFYDKVNVRRYYFSDMVLDPLFWQALGKGLGWEPWRLYRNGMATSKDYPEHEKHRWVKENSEKIGVFDINSPVMSWQRVWIAEWHRFIDHLAEGKDIQNFFTNLTDNK